MNFQSAMQPSDDTHKSDAWGLRDHLLALWTGCTQPTRFSFLLMIVVLVSTTLLMVVGVTPRTLAGPLGDYVPRSAENDEAFATIQALRLADPQAPVGKAPRVYVIGNSRIAQTFASDEKLKHSLQTLTHRDWDVFFLTTGRQGALDETALAEFATKRQPGVVILSASFDRYEDDVAELMKYYRMARIGYRSDWADEQVRQILHTRPRSRTGIYLVDNRKFFLLNAGAASLRLVSQTPAERKIDAYIYKQNAHKLATYRATILKSLRINYIPKKLSVSILADTVRRLQERGNKVILFDVPVSSELVSSDADRKRYAIHLQGAAALSSRLGAYYCRPSDEATPPPQAYRDYFHIADPAVQEQMRMLLAQCVENVSREKGRS